MTSVLITGASGFVGSGLLPQLINAGMRVSALTRSKEVKSLNNHAVSWLPVTSLNDEFSLAGYDVLIHLAARVHVMQESVADPLSEFRHTNVDMTERLARRAAAAGVRRFVFLSSIKVNGEETLLGQPFLASDQPAPEDAYGISKCEAESMLRSVAAETGLEVVIIRSPLVYGPGVKGNFQTMLNWLRRGLPLPLASLDNRRSLIGVDNLCDLIMICLSHPNAANETFLASDGYDLSTPELLRLVGDAIEHPAMLLPCPPSLLKVVAAMVGKSGVVRRLCGSLQVDIGKTQRLLGWTPPYSVQEGMRRIFISKPPV